MRKPLLNHVALPRLDKKHLAATACSLPSFIPVRETPLYHFLKFIRLATEARPAIYVSEILLLHLRFNVPQASPVFRDAYERFTVLYTKKICLRTPGDAEHKSSGTMQNDMSSSSPCEGSRIPRMINHITRIFSTPSVYA